MSEGRRMSEDEFLTPFSRRIKAANESGVTVEVNRLKMESGANRHGITVEIDTEDGGFEFARLSEKQVLKVIIALADALKIVHKVSPPRAVQ
jgi:hypothetical protein